MKKTNKSRVALLLACAIMATVGIFMQTNGTKISAQDTTLAEVDAFTQSESNPEQSDSSTPPRPWEYVRDRYIKSKEKTEKVVCNVAGEIGYSGGTVSGNYQTGAAYIIILDIKNCDGKQKGSWCHQKEVGVHVVSIERAV